MTEVDERVHVTRQQRPRRRRWRLGAGLALLIIVASLLAASAWGAWWYILLRPDVPGIEAGQVVRVEIPQGASTRDIAERLSSAGVVPNANMFSLQSRLAGIHDQLRAGVYEMTTGMSYDDAIEELRAGPKIVFTDVTIPEGWVIGQIADRFEAEAGIPASEFESLARGGYDEFQREYLRDAYEGSLEGYLFPKTYRIREEDTARDVIEMMLDQFETEIAQVDLGAAYSRGFSMHEVVTMASIIERETRVAEERVLVSSVIHNRLERDMRLQIDATIEYVLPGTRFRLTEEHLAVDSPYNTYRNAGLPPGPIANPGLASLKAAVDPAETEYVYYVLTGEDGSHTFTETWDEFLEAKAKSKEVFGQ